MDAQELELRGAILADPDDDAPRRVYADWLLDRGDERGEFVHAQLDLARTPPTDERWWELQRRVEAFLDRNTKKWTKLLPKTGQLAWGIQPEHFDRRDVYDRGLAERVTAPNTSQLERSFDEIWKHAPIRHVRVNKWSQTGSALISEPRFADRLRGLWLTWDGFDSACTMVPPFLEDVPTDRLETLRLFDRMLREDGWAALLEQDFPSLRRLEFVNTYESPVVMLDELVATPWFGGVDRLVLDRCGVGDQALAAFSRIAESSLHTLRLPGNEFGPNGIGHLLFCAGLTSVGDLSLADNGQACGNTISALATSSKVFPSLRRLDLSGLQLEPQDWKALADVDNVPTLHELVLSRTNLEDLAVRVLVSESFPELRGLDLQRVPASGEALVSLVLSDAFPQLRYVRLSDTALDRDQTKRIKERLPHTCRTSRLGTLEFGSDPAFVP